MKSITAFCQKNALAISCSIMFGGGAHAETAVPISDPTARKIVSDATEILDSGPIKSLELSAVD